jgi:monofunctional biosynthetic peptidoglycan transglycosylase
MDWGRPLRAAGDFVRDFWRGDGERTPWFRRIVATLFILLGPAPVLLLLLFRFLPVPFTPQMVIGVLSGDEVHYQWRESWAISPYLGRAVIGAEDQKFCRHNGFDWQSIDKAIQSHERHPKRRLRGASTLSQQAARSLFLVPWRSWARKGVEAYLTVLMEGLWPKQRILTAYLNLVDWGHGNFGAEAAAQAYFHKPASSLNVSEAARLAAVLPDPDQWRAVQPGPYVARRSGTLIARMRQVARDGLDSCVRR